ncbi:MAG: CDP-glucose 4,6-dehydratase [Chlamydiae bacterium]|nr:CDP-glucose 4,6-dehydratase [Chlamydiota bacterium]
MGLRNRKILITGSSGFLGQRLAWTLGKLGATVFGLDYREDQSNLDDFLLGDVRDYFTVVRAIAEFKPNIIFHLAAITQVVDAKLIPLLTYSTNIIGTANVLEVARTIGAHLDISTIVASSDKAYGRLVTFSDGTPTGRVANEHTYLNPFHPYDVSKASADFIARSYADVYGQKVAITRCGNIYGPGDDNWQRIVPDTIRSLFEGRPLIIRTDGTQKREYNYVDDIIEAYILVAVHLDSGGETGIAWTISDPNALYSTIEIAELIAVQMGRKLDMEITGGNQSEEQVISLDSSLIREQLGWKPRYLVSQGIFETVNWIKSVFYD